METAQQWTPLAMANSPYQGQVQAFNGLSTGVSLSIGLTPYGYASQSSTTNGQVINAANGQATGYFQLATWETHHWSQDTCTGTNSGTYSKVIDWGPTNFAFINYAPPGTSSDSNILTQVSVGGYNSIQFNMRFEPLTHTVINFDTTCTSPGQQLVASGSSSTSFPSFFLETDVTVGKVSFVAGKFDLSYTSGRQYEYTYTFNQGRWQYHYLGGTNYLYAFSYLGSGFCSDFGITANPTSLSMPQAGSGMSSITLTSLNGLSGSVTLSAAQSPMNYNLVACFHGNTCTSVTDSTTVSVSAGGSSSTTLTVLAGCATAPPGSYTVTVTGTSSSPSISHSTSIPVTVTAFDCGGGDGGSVAAGTLITLANRTQVPVQNLAVGMQLLSYNMTSQKYVISTITRFPVVEVNNLMIIQTDSGPPLRVDQNPAQKVYVQLLNGTVTLMSVTDLQVGYDLFQALTQTWVPITGINYVNQGRYVMYDIYTTPPGNYIANGYLDPVK